MANGNTTPTRPGQVNLAGDDIALFLKVFSGEVITTFEEMNVMKNLVTMRTISSGKSAQFPVMGRASAFYHAVGTNILDEGNSLLSTIAQAERVINVDNKLISAVVISEIDELMNHYDVRKPYSQEIGRAIAKRFDQLALHTAILTARQSATITGLNGGSVITDANMATQGAALSAALFAAAQKLDEKDVPKEDRVAVVSPAMYYNLIKDPNTTQLAGSMASTGSTYAVASNGFPLLDQRLEGSNGSYAKGVIYQVAGIRIFSSNHIPSTNIANTDAFFGNTGAGANGASARGNTYYGDFSKTKGVVFHKSALGVLKLKDISLESEYRLEYQGTAMVARLIVGMGPLRPESAVELATP